MSEELSSFRDLFFSSAYEYLKLISDSLLSLERNPSKKIFLKTPFRLTHSLKSESYSIGFKSLGDFCHQIEGHIEKIKREKRRVGKKEIDLLFKAADALEEILGLLKRGNDVKIEIKGSLEKTLEDFQKSKGKEKPEETIKKAFKPLEVIQVKVSLLDGLVNLTEELIINKIRFQKALEEKNFEELYLLHDDLGKLIDELEYYVTKARTVPVSEIFGRFPRIVRDLARQQGKEIQLSISSGNLELDRAILEKISEPLIHLIKNCVDHGIEAKKERESLGKKIPAKISLSARREKERALIIVEDDGRGFDFDKIKKKILEKKEKVKVKEELDEKKIIEELLSGGISTSDEVTGVSGRGVGLGTVKAVVDSLRGSFKIETKRGAGSKFFLEFPLTLAIIQALLVKIGEQRFAIPTSSILKSVEIEPEEIQVIAGNKVMVLDGQDIPLIETDLHLGFTPQGKKSERQLVVIVEGKEKQEVGFLIDEILELQEVIVNPLDSPLAGNKNFAGTTIMGTKEPILIIDIQGLINETERSIK